MRLFVMIVLLGMFSRAAFAAEPDVPFAKVTVGGHEGYIVPIEYTRLENASGLIHGQLGGYLTQEEISQLTYWTPSVEQVNEAEQAIEKFIGAGVKNPAMAFPRTAAHPERFAPDAMKQSAKQIGLVQENYNHYARQFLGISYGGHKRIYCNYFYPDFPAEFKTDISRMFMCINDGGYTVWQIEYDPQSKKCLHLEINGPWE